MTRRVATVTIRSAKAADQPTIRRFIKDANLNPMSLQWQNFLVAEQGRVVVGVGQVKPHRDGSLELASMAVAPGRRGQGIGAALIEKLIARQPNAVLHLTCRRELVGYYEQFGFRRLVAAEYPPYFRRLIPLVDLVARVFATRIVVMRRDLAA